MKSIEYYLDEIEHCIVIDQEEKILTDWDRFSRGEWKENYFNPRRTEFAGRSINPPEININDALESEELMVIDQLTMILTQLSNEEGRLLTFRPNYGVGTLASLFGADPFIMPREMNTLPNVRPLAGGTAALEKIASGPLPDIQEGFGSRVFKTGRILNEILRDRPLLAELIQPDHPDGQSPMDILELLWGSGLFLGLYDRPGFVHSLLKKITAAYKMFMDHWYRVMPKRRPLQSTWGYGYRGSICLRDDSAMNLPPDMYKEFIFPCNCELLDYYRGGAIHSCGRVDHFVCLLREMKNLNAFNLSQPEYNDMEMVYTNTVDRNICIIGLRQETAAEAVAEKRNLRGLVSVS